MPKLFIHIGTHKTGTTAIQRSLEAARNRLEQEQIVYLKRFHGSVEMQYLDAPDAQIVATARASLLAEIERYSPEHVFILSSETYSGNAYKGYRNAAVTAQMLQEITSEVFDARIVVYLRRQDSFLEALYTQRVRAIDSFSFEEFLRSDAVTPPLSFDWWALLAEFANRFGKDNTIVRRYEKGRFPEKNGLIGNFAAIVGSQVLPEVALEREENTGYSRDVLEIARLCNSYLDVAGRKQLRALLQAASVKRALEDYAYFPLEERHALLERYAESNARVAREYFGEPSGCLFVEPQTSETVEYEGLTPERVARVLAMALASESQARQEQMNLTSLRVLYKIEQFFKQRSVFDRPLRWLLRRLKLS
ncbi:hypothetical protein KR51_00037810 [Rubidibacter lacunae KORDI 51-2]|uniref:Uncharacterized protein n=1 Tax=Rubidibacter lacunae KORDI 51-2 TaxID=582515 RepID=U5DES7_9CHRO|nr:hypothetical protein [Rubidibacter lacunae]ERN39802.1 hypothetical protein KR51_00037810 [Rubidibacter lacunae KORDI 51-2]